MDIFYINLMSQPERRRFLEENFRATNNARWSLTRVEAVTAAEARATPGGIRDGEKACFQSHIKALKMAADSGGHVLIAEDDIQFGKHSMAAIESALAQVPEDSWDVIFTDLAIPKTQAMIDLLLLRRRPSGPQPFKLVNLSRIPFAGSTAYIVNRKSRDKLLQLLMQKTALDVPYDLYLQQVVHEGRLRGFVTFPFVTTLSPHAENSQIQQPRNIQEAVMNAFRRLMWLERDVGKAVEPIDRIRDGMDDAETAAFLKILAIILSPSFPA